MDLDPRLLRYFLAVADELNFNRAAARLPVSQPSLSVAIRGLETQLGIQLFERNANKVTLTDEGQCLVPIARDLLVRNEAAVQFIREMALGEPPVFRVGYSPFLDMNLIGSVRAGFGREAGMPIELVSAATAVQYQKLLKGELHAGLLIPAMQDHSIVIETLHREPFFVALPKSHELEGFEALSLRQIMQEPVVWFARNLNSALHDQFRAACADAGYAPKVYQEVTTILECLQFVAHGVGISFATGSVAALNVDGVSFRELKDDRFYVETALAHRADNRTAALQRFIRYVRSRETGESEPQRPGIIDKPPRSG